MALAEEGFRAMGIDLSERLLSEARKSDKDRLVTWIEGDMRQLPDEEGMNEANEGMLIC